MASSWPGSIAANAVVVRREHHVRAVVQHRHDVDRRIGLAGDQRVERRDVRDAGDHLADRLVGEGLPIGQRGLERVTTRPLGIGNRGHRCRCLCRRVGVCLAGERRVDRERHRGHDSGDPGRRPQSLAGASLQCRLLRQVASHVKGCGHPTTKSLRGGTYVTAALTCAFRTLRQSTAATKHRPAAR